MLPATQGYRHSVDVGPSSCLPDTSCCLGQSCSKAHMRNATKRCREVELMRWGRGGYCSSPLRTQSVVLITSLKILQACRVSVKRESRAGLTNNVWCDRWYGCLRTLEQLSSSFGRGQQHSELPCPCTRPQQHQHKQCCKVMHLLTALFQCSLQWWPLSPKQLL